MDTSKKKRGPKPTLNKPKKVGVLLPLVTHEKHTWKEYAAAMNKTMIQFIKDAVVDYMEDDKNIDHMVRLHKDRLKQFTKKKPTESVGK